MHISQQLAAQAVAQVFAGRNLGVSLERIVNAAPGITPQQRAVAQDLSYGTLRFYGQLQAMLAELLQKPLSDERVRYLLLVALYQLVHDKAAAHTVVNQAVQAASQLNKPWAKALVNGVLRNFLRQREALAQGHQTVSTVGEGGNKLDGKKTDLVATYSYPKWWIGKLQQQYPQNWQAMLESGNQKPPMTLRVNQKRMDVQGYLAQLAAHNIAASWLGGQAILLGHPLPVYKIPGFYAGLVSVQDFGAQLAAELLDAADGMRVLDACCAPGGKTGYILEKAEVQMVAIDSDEHRLQRTRDNLERLGLQAQLLTGDAASAEWWDGQPFDRILADVPCTASGIVRRHVDIKWLRREADIVSFTQQQAAILPSLWRLLAKGGKLLYATCSVFKEENQRQIAAFLEVHPDAKLLTVSSLAIACPSATSSVTWDQTDIYHGQLLPCVQHDGFFYALLQKD